MLGLKRLHQTVALRYDSELLSGPKRHHLIYVLLIIKHTPKNSLLRDIKTSELSKAFLQIEPNTYKVNLYEQYSLLVSRLN